MAFHLTTEGVIAEVTPDNQDHGNHRVIASRDEWEAVAGEWPHTTRGGALADKEKVCHVPELTRYDLTTDFKISPFPVANTKRSEPIIRDLIP